MLQNVASHPLTHNPGKKAIFSHFFSSPLLQLSPSRLIAHARPSSLPLLGDDDQAQAHPLLPSSPDLHPPRPRRRRPATATLNPTRAGQRLDSAVNPPPPGSTSQHGDEAARKSRGGAVSIRAGAGEARTAVAGDLPARGRSSLLAVELEVPATDWGSSSKADPVATRGGRRAGGADVTELEIHEVDDAELEVVEVEDVADRTAAVELDDAYGGPRRRLCARRRSGPTSQRDSPSFLRRAEQGHESRARPPSVVPGDLPPAASIGGRTTLAPAASSALLAPCLDPSPRVRE
jgi:hypothetical protein